MPPDSSFSYRQIGGEDIDTIQPLWEKLRAHHAGLPWPFAAEMSRSGFTSRKQELLAKSSPGKLRIELVSTPEATNIAYCLSSITAEGCGEIDSLYVDEPFRGRGIGTELIRRALVWLDEQGATSKVVSVAHANAEALVLYQRFGFHPRTILLQQVPPTK